VTVSSVFSLEAQDINTAALSGLDFFSHSGDYFGVPPPGGKKLGTSKGLT
jgi:hypothetical protein